MRWGDIAEYRQHRGQVYSLVINLPGNVSMQIKNRSGPSIDPCGTPEVTAEVSDEAPLKPNVQQPRSITTELFTNTGSLKQLDVGL